MSTFVLSAGGSGGHLYPAQAVAEELHQRGHHIIVMTDARFAKFETAFPTAAIQTIPSAALSQRSIRRLISAPFEIAAGLVLSLLKLRHGRPAVVVGFGGYPSVPVMVAACLLRIPTIIVSPDALLGRANRLVMNHVARIAANFPLVRFLPKTMSKVVYTGNPLRPAVIKLVNAPYPALDADGALNLLVFGGSQGARIFSEIIPAAVALLPTTLQARLRIVQQCRAEDLELVRSIYIDLGIKVELAPFFSDLPQRIADAHLVICRSGAGTVSELAAIGRPAILVPLPHALDDNQTPNADALADVGGGWRVRQDELTATKLAKMLTDLFSCPEDLSLCAAAARKIAKPDATQLLANLVEELGGSR